jgi:hypothetical protein
MNVLRILIPTSSQWGELCSYNDSFIRKQSEFYFTRRLQWSRVQEWATIAAFFAPLRSLHATGIFTQRQQSFYIGN